MSSDPSLFTLLLILLALGGVYYVGSSIRRDYYCAPKNRLKWHGLDKETICADQLAPQPINLAQSLQFIDVAREDTLELNNGVLIVTSENPAKNLRMDIKDIDQVKSITPGSLTVIPKDSKILATGEKGRLDFVFGKSMNSVAGLPSLPLSKNNKRDLIEADQKALRFYFSIVYPLGNISGNRAQRPTYPLAWNDIIGTGVLILIVLVVLIVKS